jgi:hypothetical protein
MTYGQTIGLTQDAPLIGNWEALRWGLLGLFVKGGIWIGFAGAFVGMGLSARRYRPVDIALLAPTLLWLYFLGIYLLNWPFDPEGGVLPRIYFSDHWYWEPEVALEPRFECWGGLLVSLVCLLAYCGVLCGDRLTLRLGLVGFASGGCGFVAGQSVQAWHAWNADAFRAGPLGAWEPYLNWWNLMETVFGGVAGAGLALGVCLSARRIDEGTLKEQIELRLGAEWLMVAVHVAVLLAHEFAEFPVLDRVTDHHLVLTLIPWVGVLAGRVWPYALVLPVTLAPIAGKTVRQLCYRTESLSPLVGWGALFVLPLGVALLAAMLLSRRSTEPQSGQRFARVTLVLTVWLYFSLNFAIFEFPWPWAPWTGRTLHGLIFAACALGLTVVVLAWRPAERASP